MKNLIKKQLQNRQKIENYIAALIILVLSTFIVFSLSSLYSLVFTSGDVDFVRSVVASFAGAFFAFLFLRVGEILEKYYQRQVKHFNALVSMEIYLDELYTIAHDNIYLLPVFRSTINSGNTFASVLRPLPVRRDYYEELHDIKLINDLYKLNYDLRRINDDLESVNDWYLHLRQLYTTGQMQPNHYIESSKILSENLKVIQAAHVLLLDDVIRLDAIIKIRSESDKPLLTRFMYFVIDKTRPDITISQIEKKSKALRVEIEESGKDSLPRIEKIKKMVSEMQ